MLAAGTGAAIVRSGLIMPIKPALATSTFLTPGLIAQMMAQELYMGGARRAIIKTHNQTHVDMVMPGSVLAMPLEQFRRDYIQPIAAKLLAKTKEIGTALEVPHGVSEGGTGNAGGFGVRFVRDYHIGYDEMIGRFDILNN